MKLLGFMLGVLFGYASIEVELCFFFSSRRRHTRWNCDWSSDVCSSDLREVESDFQPDGNYIAGDGAGQGGATLPLSGSYKVKEIFLESRIPILSNLSAEAGYRFSDYSGRSEERRVGKECRPRWQTRNSQ